MRETPESARLDIAAISQDTIELDAIIQRLYSRWPSGKPPAFTEKTWLMISPLQQQYLSAVLEMRQALRTLHKVQDMITD